MQLLAGLLYFVGNFQDFMDETQTLLLRIIEFTGLVFIVTALYYQVLNLVVGFRWKIWFIGEIVFTSIGLIVSSGLFLLIKFLLTWFQGYGT
jgi:hypothetical protein